MAASAHAAALRHTCFVIVLIIWLRLQREGISCPSDERGVMKQSSTGVSRRDFVKTAAATGAAIAIVPRHVLGRGFTPPSDLLNVAGVGVGGMGGSNMINLASQNIVAMCDVDWGFANKRFDRLDAPVLRVTYPDTHPPFSNVLEQANMPNADKIVDGLRRLAAY